MGGWNRGIARSRDRCSALRCYRNRVTPAEARAWQLELIKRFLKRYPKLSGVHLENQATATLIAAHASVVRRRLTPFTKRR
jgi:hypothetical protein